jgi:hypothetical protein
MPSRENKSPAEKEMIDPSELDIAQLKFEMRKMYGHIGFDGSMQVLYEMIVGANILAEIIAEEKSKSC